MSDFSQGPGWWLASDGKWYPPQGEQQAAVPQQQQWSTPQGQPQYGQQPQYTAYGQPGAGGGLPSVNGLAVASMVLGIVSLVFCWCWYIGGVCAIVGLPLGAVALSKISKGDADPKPKGMAIAGVVCSIISIALIIVIVVAFASAVSSIDTSN